MSGLADVDVTVEQLATAVGLNVQDLSNPTNLDGTVILGGGSGVLSQLGAQLGGSVSGLVSQLGGLASNNSPIPLRQFLDPVLATLSPDTPVINLFDLLMALGQAANADSSGARSIELPNVEASIPSIAGLPGVDVRAFLRVLEAPKVGRGKAGVATANNAQVRLEVRAGVSTGVLSTLVNGLGGTLANPLNIGINVTAAQSVATLESLQCPIGGVNNGMPIAVLDVDNSVANVRVGTFSGAVSSAPALNETGAIPLLGLPAIPLLLPSGLNLQLGLSAVVGGSTGDSTPEFRDFERQQDTETGRYIYQACGGSNTGCAASGAYPNPATVGTGVNIQSLNINLGSAPSNSCPPLNLVCGALQGTLQLLLGTVTTLVNTVLTPLVNFLSNLLINPLLDSLGVGLAGATLTMTSVTVSQPELITLSPDSAN